MKTIFIVTVIVLLLTGCATDHKAISTDEKNAAIAGYELPIIPGPHESMLYLIRPDIFLAGIQTEVYLNGDKTNGIYQGKTTGRTFLAFSLPPGNHNINVRIPDTILFGVLKPKWSSINVNTVKGETIYVLQTPVPGPYFELDLLNETDAKYYLKSSILKNTECRKSTSQDCTE